MEENKQKIGIKFVWRILIYILGLFFLAMGVAFSINSNLGVSPVNSLPYVVSLISGQALSVCVIIVYAIYILVQVLILRKEFKIINLTQIIFSTIFGYFTDLTKWILGDFAIPGYGGQLVMLLISLIFIAVGISLYLDAKLIPMPMEGMTMAIASKVKKLQFSTVKIIVDCSSVAIAVILSFIFLGSLQGVREGTVVTAVLAGILMRFIQKGLQPVVNKICF